jgi:hypothetical protein
VEHEEFLAVVEKCREARGALSIVRQAADALEKPPLAFARLEKLVQGWTNPIPIDRAVRLAIQVLEDEPTSPGVVRARSLLSALLLARASVRPSTCGKRRATTGTRRRRERHGRLR